MVGRLHKPSQSSNCAPCDQDADYPHARPDLVKDEIIGDFEEEVAPKENSRGESELLPRDRPAPDSSSAPQTPG